MSSNISVTNVILNTTSAKVLRNGYDMIVIGLDDGQFLSLHIPALVCIFSGLICAAIVISASFINQRKHRRTFFKWSKSERLAAFVLIISIFSYLWPVVVIIVIVLLLSSFLSLLCSLMSSLSLLVDARGPRGSARQDKDPLLNRKE